MMAKKILSVLMLTIIFFLIVPSVQATDYATLKNEYIAAHPGQAIVPFPWETTTSTRVLPFNYEIPAAPGNNLSVTACRDEFEPASFIINAQKDLSGITITVPNLYDDPGNTIPSSAIDVRLVKVWYQASTDQIYYSAGAAGHNLTPELLLKEDSLVKVDYVTKTNYLKVTTNGVQQYIDISNPSATFPSDAQIHDAASLQPFLLKANENKQIWITVHVPSTTPAGNYSGNITISDPTNVPVTMNLNVRVLPFDLEPAPLDYGLYYTSIYWPTRATDVSGTWYKSRASMKADLQDMKDHGALYPTFFQDDDGYLDTVLGLYSSAGLPKDKIYLGSWDPRHNAYIGNGTTPTELAAIAAKVNNWRNHTSRYGYKNTYFYGMDEVKGPVLASQRPAWQTVHNNGGKIWVATGYGVNATELVGDLLDSNNHILLNSTYATEWHTTGHEITSYGNPMCGIENPEIYRKNYGFALWNAGYDGAMNVGYQFREGRNVWNDYDYAGTFDGENKYRDHVFAYPTSEGPIDTIQWEGWREGVDDTRYVATLIKNEGNITSAKSIVSAGLSNNENMTTIRKKIIERIQFSQLLNIKACWIPEYLNLDQFCIVLHHIGEELVEKLLN